MGANSSKKNLDQTTSVVATGSTTATAGASIGVGVGVGVGGHHSHQHNNQAAAATAIHHHNNNNAGIGVGVGTYQQPQSLIGGGTGGLGLSGIDRSHYNIDGAKESVAGRKATGIPTVIRWAGGQAHSVKITGSFNNWDKQCGIPLSKSGEDFYVIVNLDKGEHEFKFIVDGKEAVDTTQATLATGQGMCNVITVNDDSILGSTDMDDPMHLFGKAQSKIEGYGQEETVFEETRKFPPLCPPHLRYTPLNSTPQKRYFGDAPSGAMTTYRPSGDPCVLPMPLHVTVNHVYFQRRDGYSLMGSTCRYKSKYCTVVLYKPDVVPEMPTSPTALCNISSTSETNNNDMNMAGYDNKQQQQEVTHDEQSSITIGISIAE